MLDKNQDAIPDSVDDIVNSILSNAPQTDEKMVRLPSLGAIYGLKQDYVTLRAMTFDDEKALLNARNPSDAINMLISRCVKEDINPRDMIAQDKMFIVVNIRTLSVGNDYDLIITCGNCGHQNDVKIDVINTFPCDYPDEPISHTVEFELPVLKKKIVVRRATSSELEMPTTQLLEKLWQFVISIDGKSDGQIRHAVMQKIPRKDAHEIIKNLGCQGIGLDTRFMLTCENCQSEEVHNIAFNEDFFTMK